MKYPADGNTRLGAKYEMEMIGHQAVTIEPEWIPQQGLAQRLQERAAIIIIVEDALPIITTIKNVETEIM